MDFSISESAAALRDAVGDVLDSAASPSNVDATKVWHQLAEVGAVGTLVPEEVGGLGLDANHLVPTLERIGLSGLPLPVVETVAVAAPLFAAVGDDRLAAVVAGDLVATAQFGPSGLVPHASQADVVLLRTRDGIALFDKGSLPLDAVDSVDAARGLARLTDLPSGGVLLTSDPGWIDDAWQRGVLGTAAVLNGLSLRMLDMTVAYVKTREQFGVPIGSFQAVKHHLANCLLAVEFARPAALAAAWSMDPTDISMAKALASDAARLVARLTLQSHGAIAYTTEYDHHHFAKRAWALAEAYGSARWHRTQIAAHLGLKPNGRTTA